jgi:hypothetical protein
LKRRYFTVDFAYEKSLDESVAIRRDLAARDPNAYRPDLAKTLTSSLGILYSDTGRFADAEKAFDETVAIRRDLAARDPNRHQPHGLDGRMDGRQVAFLRSAAEAS